MERRIETIARLWQAHPDFGRDVPGICTENENSVTRENCFLDVVRHHEYGLGAQLASVRNVSAVRTSSAENGSSMRSNIGLLTIALAKPARWLIPPRKFARIGGLEAVKADKVDCRHGLDTRRRSGTPRRCLRQGRRAASRDSALLPTSA
jgi:hypothetical protein